MSKHTDLQPTTLVIFGITGDLAHRKLLPALYNLARQELLPKPCKILGVTRRGMDVDELIGKLKASLKDQGQKAEAKTLRRLSDMIEIVQMDLLKPEDYHSLRARLDSIEKQAGVCMSRLYYLAIPAQTYDPVIRQLGNGKLNKSCSHGAAPRLLIEKPFGYDLASAQELITELGNHFKEEQIYRIDHYLAKETAQNILVFRFRNPLFRSVWNGRAISHIMITAAEQIDIEGRVKFYEQTGAVRDVVQSHLLQLLALVTMDEPAALTSAEIHQQKLALLRAVTPIAPDKVATHAVRGQYQGYRDEVKHRVSLTETYAALRLQIDSERWRNVPILLRTGKALKEKVVEISIVFSDHSRLTADNILTIRIQPSEGISLQLMAKKPGFDDETEPVGMDFCYSRSFNGDAGHPDAYERVLIDALRGDKTLFATGDEVIASWRILENVIHEWAKDDHGLHAYKRGTWGPKAADQLAEQADTAWPVEHLNVC